jgi:micrococcal nuclease
VDGDTIHALIDGQSERVHLIGLDTPESVEPRKPVECFGRDAARRTADLLAGGLRVSCCGR